MPNKHLKCLYAKLKKFHDLLYVVDVGKFFPSLCFILFFAISGLSCSRTLSCGMWDPVPWPGIEPRPPTLEAWSLSHWTTGKSPSLYLRMLITGPLNRVYEPLENHTPWTELSFKRPAHQAHPPPTDKPPQEGKVSFEMLQKQEAFEEEKRLKKKKKKEFKENINPPVGKEKVVFLATSL